MEQTWLYPDTVLLQKNCAKYGPEAYLDDLRRMHVRRVWIWPMREQVFLPDPEYLARLKRSIDFFRAHGFESGIWTTSLGFGGAVEGEALRQRTKHMTRLRSITGEDCNGDAICPTDEDYIRCYQAWIRALAALDPDLIMLDDEHCLSVRPGIGCFCDRHLELLSEALGERVTLDGLPERIFTGGQNRYRDAWYQVMGDTMREYFRKVRAAADDVNPDLRVGICAGYTSWDIEGLDVIEMAKILAGKNRPFLRYTGAPYWVTPMRDRFHGQKLCSVIESTRLQRVWTNAEGIEAFSENDSWPRSAFHTAASLCELFELAMQADGVRSLDYVFKYNSSPYYEKNFLNAYLRDIPLFTAIRTAFAGKRATGVRIFRNMHTIRTECLPEHFIGEKNVERLFFSQSAAMLSGLGVPTCYEGDASVGAAFGNEAEAVPAERMPRRMILDFAAARLLAERGVDVGIASFFRAPIPSRETDPGESIELNYVGEGAPLASTGGFWHVNCRDGAQIVSSFRREEAEWPAAYIYDNGTTEFLIFAFDAAAVGESSTVFASYLRQEQLYAFTEHAFPCIRRHPDVYTICADDGTHRAVLFENMSPDPVFDFEIELGEPCAAYTLHGAQGLLSDDRRSIRVTTDFAPSAAILMEIDSKADGKEVSA